MCKEKSPRRPKSIHRAPKTPLTVMHLGPPDPETEPMVQTIYSVGPVHGITPPIPAFNRRCRISTVKISSNRTTARAPDWTHPEGSRPSHTVGPRESRELKRPNGSGPSPLLAFGLCIARVWISSKHHVAILPSMP